MLGLSRAGVTYKVACWASFMGASLSTELCWVGKPVTGCSWERVLLNVQAERSSFAGQGLLRRGVCMHWSKNAGDRRPSRATHTEPICSGPCKAELLSWMRWVCCHPSDGPRASLVEILGPRSWNWPGRAFVR